MGLQSWLLLYQLLVEWIFERNRKGSVATLVQVVGLALAPLELDIVRILGFGLDLKLLFEVKDC